MQYVSHCYYNPDRDLVLNLAGSDSLRPMYAVGDCLTPNPISMHESPLWIHNTIPPGQLGYRPHGYKIVSPFGIKYVYR